ncbi:MAG TPA: DUF4235 domain-containing protein [Acidimicrobiales bacterium]
MASILKSSSSESRWASGEWKIVSTIAGIIGGLVARKLIEVVWKSVRSGAAQDPPLNPADRRIGWGDAVAWAVAAGVGAGVGRLISERLAAAGWEAATGSLPPGIED